FTHYFIHAEDGIRYFHVTGVQTCALPIFVDTVLASRISQLSAIAAQPVRPTLVRIEFDEPDHAPRYEALFSCPVEFAAAGNQLRLDKTMLALRNPEHCPGTWHHLLELCEAELEQRTRTRSLRERKIGRAHV